MSFTPTQLKALEEFDQAASDLAKAKSAYHQAVNVYNNKLTLVRKWIPNLVNASFVTLQDEDES